MLAGPVSPSLQYAASNGTSKGTGNSAHSRPQIADATGVTTLMWAARAGHEVTVAELLHDPHLDANVRDVDGWTALTHACDAGQEGVVRLLLARRGIEVNALTKGGITPYHFASAGRHDAIIAMLQKAEGFKGTIRSESGHRGSDVYGLGAAGVVGTLRYGGHGQECAPKQSKPKPKPDASGKASGGSSKRKRSKCS